MRGLLNIFSLGMDQLATEIQSHGISADVYNHTVADSWWRKSSHIITPVIMALTSLSAIRLAPTP